MSERSQLVLLYLSLALATIYAAAWVFLFRMMPPPPADWPAEQVKAFYIQHQASILWGAVINGWTGMALLPMWAVIATQIWRQERGRAPIWTIVASVAGLMMSMGLAAPAFCWGVAAFHPRRSADVVALAHDFGVLALDTTDQLFVFNMAAVAVISLMRQTAPHSPFRRWYGFLTAFCTTVAECGALAFLFQKGPFAWDGLFPFWVPIAAFGSWMLITVVLLRDALHHQLADLTAQPRPAPAPA